MDLIKALNWRYATKRMTGAKVPAEKLTRILEATQLSASSYGLQPYTILVIEDLELRKKLQPLAYNQPQIVEASHLLVFTAWTNITTAQIQEFIDQIATERGISTDSLKGYQSAIENHVNNSSPEKNFNWAARQAYIALGSALIAAAAEEVDATPMEGFNPKGFDEVLQLADKGLGSVVILALGYRDADNDHLAKAKKIRRATDKLFIHL